MTTNEKLRNTTIRHAHFIEQYKNDEVQKIIAMLNKTDASLRTQLLKYKGKTPTITSKRLALMRKDIKDIVEDSKLILKNKLEGTAIQFGNMESKWLGDIIKDAVPGEVPISFIQPSPTQILAAIKARPFNNETLQGMIDGWALTKKNTLINAVQQAFVQGQSIDDAVKTLFGTKALQYTDALIDGSRRQIRTQVRTALNHFSSVSREITYKANADLIKGVQWVSTLDGRTTLQCINLDGKIDYDDGSVRELNGLRPPAHYNCYHKDTEVYTDVGWKLFSAIDGTEKFLSFNPENEKEQKYQKAINHIAYKHDGKLIDIKNHDFEMVVTPEHNMVIKYHGQGESKKFRFVKAKDMPKWNNRIYRGLEWEGEDISTVMLGNKEIDAKTYCKFMGYYLSEGSTTKKKNDIYYSTICQYKHVNKLFDDLKDLPFSITKVSSGINIYDRYVGEDLRKYGHSHEKYVPEIIKNMSKENIEVFLNAYVLGDGTKMTADTFGYKNEGFKMIFTSSERMKEDIGELILKVGGRPSYTKYSRKGKSCKFKNGLYTTNHDIWQISWCKNVYSQTEHLTKTYVEYNDYVYCVELPEWHTLLVRYNGKVAWSGNCRSTTVPVIKSLKELGLSDKEFRPSTRASMNGQVPETMRYKDWFAKQDEKFQRQVLGAKKYDLWKSGQFTFDKFVDNGTTLNLNQLSMIDNINVPSVPPFVEAKTIDEAEKWAIDTLGISSASYKGANIDVVNEMNRSVYDNFTKFPKLKETFRDIGTSQNMREVFAKRYADAIYSTLSDYERRRIGYSGLISDAKRRFGNVSSNVWASSFEYNIKSKNIPLLNGVGINAKYAKNPTLWKSDLKYGVVSKFHPIGCDTIKSVIDHEMGHELDKLLGRLSSTDKFINITKKYNIAKDLSGYPMTYTKKHISSRYREVLAEGWSEYLNNLTPRPFAKEIGDMIIDEYKNKFGGL